MKDNWEEMLDQLEEKELTEYLPETLPEVDEVTKKRIEKQTLKKMKKEQKHFSRKQIAVAVICLVAVLGVVGREPIQAAFERLFHYLPGAGMYVDEEENVYYEAEIITGEFTENDIHVRLKNVYAENHAVHMEVEMTGNLVELTREEYENDSPDKYDKLEEMYALTMEYDGKEHEISTASRGVLAEDENDTYMIMRYRRDYQRYVKNVEQTYTVRIVGLENTLSFRLTSNTGKEQPENIGASQTQNDITITAKADVAEQGIWLEYYILTDERLTDFDDYFAYRLTPLPYGCKTFDSITQEKFQDMLYVTNKDGERLRYRGQEAVENGRRMLLEGTAEDFPITFHRASLTGVGRERESVEIPMPESIRSLDQTVAFPYGTVTFEKVKAEKIELSGQNAAGEEIVAEVKDLEITYTITPNEGKRQLYGVFMEAKGSLDGYPQQIFPDEDGKYRIHALVGSNNETVTLELYDPYYWIVDDYDLVLEKPESVK
ncbi:hypothetical protein [Anaerotignum sp.]|uniref:hypothetical protein n=1 Tax=Anaerotignum sp. TaxID=2039241 RepID=UPI002A915C56|nr:hypothetical protein [Anaerotignum sp.]MCI7656814.1 hypothetical protein [Clostridia bacterium]MDY5414975.1 hypothetical protein [Anaerotignum sp.]